MHEPPSETSRSGPSSGRRGAGRGGGGGSLFQLQHFVNLRWELCTLLACCTGASKGHVWKRHSAPAAPALTWPSSPSPFHFCASWRGLFQHAQRCCSLAFLKVGGGGGCLQECAAFNNGEGNTW